MPLPFTDTGGNQPVMILLHGWCCGSGTMTPLADALASDHRIILPELPGHGGTPLGDFQPGFENYTQALAGFVRQFDSPILAGHSMGGALALMTAAQTPVKAVINIDGSLPPSDESEACRRRLAGIVGFPGWKGLLGGALRNVMFLPQERDGTCEEILRQVTHAPDSVLRFYPEQAGEIDVEGILPRIKSPTLYVAADPCRFDEDSARRLIPHARFAHVSDAGHFLPVYAPDRLAGVIREFLAGI